MQLRPKVSHPRGKAHQCCLLIHLLKCFYLSAHSSEEYLRSTNLVSGTHTTFWTPGWGKPVPDSCCSLRAHLLNRDLATRWSRLWRWQVSVECLTQVRLLSQMPGTASHSQDGFPTVLDTRRPKLECQQAYLPLKLFCWLAGGYLPKASAGMWASAIW